MPPSSVALAAGFSPAAALSSASAMRGGEKLSDNPNSGNGRSRAAKPPGDEGKPAGFPLYLHHLGLFASGQGVDPLDLGLGHLLQPGVGALRLVLRYVALLLHLVDAVDLVPAHVADRHPGLLGLVAHELDVLLAALFVEGRD